MSTETSTPTTELLRDAQRFSLVLGGPLFQLLRYAHLSDDALLMLRRRVIVLSLLAWVPLLVLTALEGHLVGRGISVPFLSDLETHIRFLVVVPLLLVAERVVHQRLLPIGRVPRAQPDPFDGNAALRSGARVGRQGGRGGKAEAARATCGALFVQARA